MGDLKLGAIHLLRCKAEPLAQADAFSTEMAPLEVITRSFIQRPTAQVRRNSTWHIGNTVDHGDGVISFALGREAVLLSPQFDEKMREFKEVEQVHAPFTVGVFDSQNQTIGILIRPGVSLNAREVAGKLEKLLQSTGVAQSANRRISVDFIPDPTGFIESVSSAYRITRFEFSFTLPNPPDDNKYIQRPLKDFALRAKATEGRAAFRGDSLEKSEVIELAGAIAASGDDATANLQMTPKAKSVRKNLSANAVSEPLQLGSAEGFTTAILRAMRKAYDSVRNPVLERGGFDGEP